MSYTGLRGGAGYRYNAVVGFSSPLAFHFVHLEDLINSESSGRRLVIVLIGATVLSLAAGAAFDPILSWLFRRAW